MCRLVGDGKDVDHQLAETAPAEAIKPVYQAIGDGVKERERIEAGHIVDNETRVLQAASKARPMYPVLKPFIGSKAEPIGRDYRPMPNTIGGRKDQGAAGAEDTAQLVDGSRWLRDVLDHLSAERYVENRILEREVLDVAHNPTAGALFCDPRQQRIPDIQRRHIRPSVGRGLAEQAGSAACVQEVPARERRCSQSIVKHEGEALVNLVTVHPSVELARETLVKKFRILGGAR